MDIKPLEIRWDGKTYKVSDPNYGGGLVVKWLDHQVALKAKDEEIKAEQQRIDNLYRTEFDTLLATAVKFAELISFDHQGKWQDEADTFLDRPEVQAWRKGQP